MRLSLRSRMLELSTAIGFITLTLVLTLVYAASDSGTTHDVTWSYWVGALAYSGATEETDSRHSYYIRNGRDESIKLEWEFSHKVIGGGQLHDATEDNAGSPITIPSGGSRSVGKLIRTGVEHLPEDHEYTIKAYTAVRVNPPQGAQLFAEGEDDGEELSFWR